MKTQVVQLEHYDDVVSVRDKMGWGQTSRILLVWPTHGNPLQRKLDLILLQRHSQAIGAQLGLVCEDPEVRANAHDLGIPIFQDIRRAQTGRWRLRQRRKPTVLLDEQIHAKNLKLLDQPRLNKAAGVIPRKIRLMIFGASMAAVLTLLILILPGAQLTLEPLSIRQEIILPIRVDPQLADVNLSGGLPARWHTLIVEGRASIPSTGLVSVPEKPASGEVSFTNLGENPLLVPGGTIVSTLAAGSTTEVIRFATQQTIQVPGGVGKTVRAPVIAVLPGQEGNLDIGAVRSIEGSLGLLLSVTNPVPLRGGSSRQVPGPTDFDRQKLYNQLLASLQRSAVEELMSAWHSDNLHADLPITPTIQMSQIITSTYRPAEKLPAAQLELTLRAGFKMLVVPGSDLEKLAIPVMDAALAQGQRGIAGTLQISLNTPLRQTGSGAVGELRLVRHSVRIIDAPEAANLGRGLPASQAGSILKERLGLASPAGIILWPSWWPILPLLPMRIEVNSSVSP